MTRSDRRPGGRGVQRSQQSSKRSRSVEDDKEGHLVCRIGDWLQERCTATFRKTLPLLLPPRVSPELSSSTGGGFSLVGLFPWPVSLPEAERVDTRVLTSVAVRDSSFLFARSWFCWCEVAGAQLWPGPPHPGLTPAAVLSPR